MSENTSVGPAGSNAAPMPVTGHETYGHLDDNADGGLTGGSVGDATEVGPNKDGADFGGVQTPTVEPGNSSLSPMSGPVEPLGFDG